MSKLERELYYLFMFFYPFAHFFIIPKSPVLLFKFCIGLLLILVFFLQLVKKTRRFAKEIIILITLVLFLYSYRIYFSSEFSYGIYLAIELVFFSFFLIFVASYLKWDDEYLKKGLDFFVYGVFVCTLGGLIYKVGLLPRPEFFSKYASNSHIKDYIMVIGFSSSIEDASFFRGVSLVWLLYRILNKSTCHRNLKQVLFWFLLSIVLYYVMFFGHGRSGLVLFIIYCTILSFYKNKAIFAFVVFATSIYLLLAPNVTRVSLLNFNGSFYQLDKISSGRALAYAYAFKFISTDPLWGLGATNGFVNAAGGIKSTSILSDVALSSAPSEYREKEILGRSLTQGPANDFILYFAEGGAVLFAIFSGIWIWLLAKSRRSIVKGLYDARAFVFSALIVANISGGIFFSLQSHLVMWIIVLILILKNPKWIIYKI